jgi:FAD/FMN-containing dehydrogenase
MSDLVGKTLYRLSERLPGRVSTPGDDAYAEATAVWAKPVNRTPRAVIHCHTVDDVRFAIRAARDCDLPLSVRGGGHDWAGRALCEGVVIDMTGMNGVTIGPEGTAQVGGGARAADLAAAAHPFGLAAVTGAVGAVGMAGFTLGGGYGSLIGRFGLALDNLEAAEIVLADGRVVIAKPDNEADLFWALRGGGGNFGVVTTMRFKLHPLRSVRMGVLLYPFTEAKAVIERCADIADSAPDELSVQVGVVHGPDGSPLVFVSPTWCGAAEDGEARTAPFLNLGTLLMGNVETMSYRASLAAFDAFVVNGRRTFMETCWIPRLGHASIDAFITAMKAAASPGCAVITHEFKGFATRVPEEATAFGLRRKHVVVEILAQCSERSDVNEEERHRQWARRARRSFDAVALPGGYPNFLVGDDDPERIRRSYGLNAERLIKTKRRYDPDNVFRSAIPLPVASAMPGAR